MLHHPECMLMNAELFVGEAYTLEVRVHASSPECMLMNAELFVGETYTLEVRVHASSP